MLLDRGDARPHRDRLCRRRRHPAAAFAPVERIRGDQLKILHTESSCGWGGQEIRILTESAGLIARGHEVRIACPAEAPLANRAAQYGVPVVHAAIARKNLKGLIAMKRLLAGERFDVVNTHSSTDSWLAGLARGGLAHAPAIVRTRHVSTPVRAGATNRWLYRRAANHVVTTGESIRQHLIDVLGADPGRVSSVPTGIDATRFVAGDRRAARRELGLPQQAFLVGIVATVRIWKGHRYLVEAIAQIDRPDVLAVVVGEGPTLEEIRGRVRQLGVVERVVFAGHQTNIPTWLSAFDAFALLSYESEGVPQALLQAMFCGLPCITTTAGAIPEIAIDERTALIVPMHDAVAVAAAIRRLAGDAALRERLGQAARKHCAAGFGLERMLDRMEAIFRQAAGR